MRGGHKPKKRIEMMMDPFPPCPYGWMDRDIRKLEKISRKAFSSPGKVKVRKKK